MKNFTTDQLRGIGKLLSYKQSLIPDESTKQLSFQALLHQMPGNFLKKQAQAFVNIFCEYQLADTDYDIIQQHTSKYPSPETHIQHMPLDVVIKTLTFIIWTDRIIDGYFFAKIHDKTLYWLLSRLEALLPSGHQPSIA